MANTYSKIYVHIVFSVKRRENIIERVWKNELYKYICGIVNGNKQKVFAIGGMSDHIHILASIKPDISLSDLVREIKVNSSKWINLNNLVKGRFNWQEGFGAFSCSHSRLDAIISYINNQEQHHSKKSFKDEYLTFLQKYDIKYDEKYVFEWIE